jgi:phage shock protein C
MAMFCKSCGTELPHSARFCSNCGTTVNAPPVMPIMPRRPLFRPHAGRVIAGVCIGLAQAYGWDVALVRIFTVVVFFFSGGIMGIAYLACWIGIPQEPLALPSAYPPNI